MTGRAPPPISFNRLIRLLLTVAALILAFRLIQEAFDGGEGSPAASASPKAASAHQRRLPQCSHEDLTAKHALYDEWASTLVDTAYALKPSYVPPDLASVRQAGFEEVAEVRKLVILDLTDLRRAAEEAGNPIGIAAAYRSWYSQESLYKRRIDEEGHGVARAKTARPGHSEHQLGTTLDFKTAGAADVDSAWEATPAGKWMAANAWKYGFVMSYPAGDTRKTCYWYEPWHYRYFGKEKAALMFRQSGLSVREFLWQEQH